MDKTSEINNILNEEEIEDVNATDTTQGTQGGSILEIGAWVYRF